MKKLAKTIMFALLLAASPVRIWAQDYTPYDNGFLFNVFEIENVEERVQLASALATSDIWLCNPTDNPGELFIRPNSYYADIPIYAEFDYLRMTLREEYEAVSSLPKEEFGEVFNSWARNISDEYYNFLISDHLDRANHCMDAEPFCTSNVYTFPSNNSGYSWSGPDYGCLGSSPTNKHSFWYYMRIGVAGNITIKMEAPFDIDFALWGPFSNQTDPCPTAAGQTGLLTSNCTSCPNNTSNPNFYPSGNLHDCSFSAQAYEYAHVVNGQVGQYYILLITNYNGGSGNITFQKYAGDGETDCGIMPPLVDNDGPYCVGETIHLTANGQAGASYSWTGPGGFTSNQQNPTRLNCTMAMAGTYTCTISLGGQTNSATTDVVVHPQPTANFTSTIVCAGETTQFTSTSTTNPSGQQISSYQWNFGDGQTSTQQNPSHQYATSGNYTVTLTVSCGHCTSTKVQSVTVNTQPAANAGPDQTIPYGTSTQLSGSGGAGTFNYHWEPENMVTNPNTQNTQTVALTQDQTYTLTVTNPQGGCSSTDQVNIYISGSAMTVTAGPDISICQGGSGEIYVSAGGGTGNLTYSWTPTTGLSNPNISNPIASPSQTTTYTCHVTDGQTSQNVSVTVTVNDVIVEDEYMTICPDDVYHWHGAPYTGVGTYQFDTVTSQGCDKTIYLHLDHYPTYDETTITEAICYGESYTFYGTTYSAPGFHQIQHTDHTMHGCDSIVRLELTVWPENQIEELSIPLCPDQLPYYYEEDPNQIPLYEGLHIFHPEDEHGCERTVHVDIQVSEYYMPPTKLEHVCELPYIWEIRDVDNSLLETITIDSANFYIDTVQTAACQGIFRLDLRYQPVPETIVEDTTVCDSYIWQVTGLPYSQTDTYHHWVSLSPFPCDQEYQLNLVVNKSDLTGEPEHPEDFDSKCDSIQFEWFGNTTYFKENGDYLFSSINPNAFIFDSDAHTQTEPGCDTATMVKVTNMKYTPLPDKYGPSDGTTSWFGLPEEEPNDPTNDTAMCAAVVTNTEFFSFQYQFFVEDVGKSVWDTCIWTIDKLSWHIDPAFSDDRKSSTCWVYVADREEDLVVLTATARNSCGEKTKKFYLKSSFLGVDENGLVPVNVNIVPNPNNGQMHLNFENMQGRTAVKVFDMTGNQIDAFETTISSNRYNYDYNMKKYADGIYFFVISNSNRVLTKKVVVIR